MTGRAATVNAVPAIPDAKDASAPFGLDRRAVAEFVGTALLLAVVVGSGIMGATLAPASDAIALLANTVSTGAGLTVLIMIFGPISGAHFNPAVTLVMWLDGAISRHAALVYVVAQVLGGLFGVLAAHVMFDAPALQVSTTARDGLGQMTSEAIATFGLLASILATVRFRPDAVPFAVGLYITSAYWFTASTSFANPAVTIARATTDTFAGIAPASAPAFIAAQFVGAVLALALFRWLLNPKDRS